MIGITFETLLCAGRCACCCGAGANTMDCGAAGAGAAAVAGCESAKWIDSVGIEATGSRGERSANRSVVLISAIASRSACLGVTTSVAVDVASGVEERPGRKDHAKVEEFIRRAKAA